MGSVADYARWAQEVPGVGNVFVMPEWDGAGTVKVVVLDANGQPANASILDAVNEHIMSPSNPYRRMAPIGAVVTIAAPTAKNIQYTFSLVLEPGESKNTVLTRFSEALQSYYVNAKSEGQVKYTKVAALLADTDGVSDFTTLLINNKEANIIIAEDQYPVTASISVQVVSHI